MSWTKPISYEVNYNHKKIWFDCKIKCKKKKKKKKRAKTHHYCVIVIRVKEILIPKYIADALKSHITQKTTFEYSGI